MFVLVCHYFDEVTSLPHVKDKWITMEIWYHLLLQNTSIDKELIDFSRFKQTIKKTILHIYEQIKQVWLIFQPMVLES